MHAAGTRTKLCAARAKTSQLLRAQAGELLQSIQFLVFPGKQHLACRRDAEREHDLTWSAEGHVKDKQLHQSRSP